MHDFVQQEKWLNLRPEAASTAEAIQIGHAEVMRLDVNEVHFKIVAKTLGPFDQSAPKEHVGLGR
jgi:hypothetical protein